MLKYYGTEEDRYAEELMCVASDHALRLRSDYFAVESYGGEVANVYGLGFDGNEWYVVATVPGGIYDGEVLPLYTEDMSFAVELFTNEYTLLSLGG